MSLFKALSSICVVGGIVGVSSGAIYKYSNPNPSPDVFDYLVASISLPSSSVSRDVELYSGDVKNFRCKLTSSASSDVSEYDEDCEVYSLSDSDSTDKKISEIKELATDKKVKDIQTLLSPTTTPAYYQISLKRSVLDKFENISTQGVQVDLVPKASDSKQESYATFTSQLRFKDSSLYGKAKYFSVSVKLENKSSDTSCTHESFSLNGVDGYKLVNLSALSALEIDVFADLKYVSPSESDDLNQSNIHIPVGVLSVTDEYILVAPDSGLIELNGSIDKTFQFIHKTNTCDYSLDITIKQFLSINSK